MKQAKSSRTDELRREYKRSDFPKAFVRGEYAARVRAGSTVVGSDAQTAVVSAMASGLLRKRTADILCAASEPCCSLLPAGSEPV
jgi:hypothetical protein